MRNWGVTTHTMYLSRCKLHNVITEQHNRQTASHFCLFECFNFQDDLTLLQSKSMFNSYQTKGITVIFVKLIPDKNVLWQNRLIIGCCLQFYTEILVLNRSTEVTSGHKFSILKHNSLWSKCANSCHRACTTGVFLWQSQNLAPVQFWSHAWYRRSQSSHSIFKQVELETKVIDNNDDEQDVPIFS